MKRWPPAAPGHPDQTVHPQRTHLLALVAPSCFVAAGRAFVEQRDVPTHCAEPVTR